MGRCWRPELFRDAMQYAGQPGRWAVIGVVSLLPTRFLVVASVALSMSACESGYSVDRVPPLAPESAGSDLAGPLAPKYTIGPGDDLLVNSFYHAELKQPVTVQSDGRVSLLLVGTVTAAGKTMEQVGQELTGRYSKFLENADVTVTLSGSAALAVYVGGEVGKPSVVPIKGALSLLQSVTAAGGFNKTANKEQVLIVRQANDGHFRTFQVNADDVLRNESPEIYLKQHDIVYVPQTAIAQADQFVDQYINQIVPRSVQGVFGFQYSSTIGAASTAINSSTVNSAVTR
jgi:polysaccharide biosynthesis/export protein PslD